MCCGWLECWQDKTKSAKVFSESQQKLQLSLGTLSESLTTALLDLTGQDGGSTSTQPMAPVSTDEGSTDFSGTEDEDGERTYSLQNLNNQSKSTDTVSASTKENKTQAVLAGKETSTDTTPIFMKDNHSQSNTHLCQSVPQQIVLTQNCTLPPAPSKICRQFKVQIQASVQIQAPVGPLYYVLVNRGLFSLVLSNVSL